MCTVTKCFIIMQGRLLTNQHPGAEISPGYILYIQLYIKSSSGGFPEASSLTGGRQTSHRKLHPGPN